MSLFEVISKAVTGGAAAEVRFFYPVAESKNGEPDTDPSQHLLVRTSSAEHWQDPAHLKPCEQAQNKYWQHQKCLTLLWCVHTVSRGTEITMPIKNNDLVEK